MGISTIMHQGKKIYLINFSESIKTKEETLSLITATREEFIKNPLNSVLALFDVTNAFFHFDIFKAFREFEERCAQYEKKVAILGLKGMRKTTFTSIAGNKKSIRVFSSESDAMKWLTSD